MSGSGSSPQSDEQFARPTPALGPSIGEGNVIADGFSTRAETRDSLRFLGKRAPDRLVCTDS